MEEWVVFLQERWLVIILALIALFVVVTIVKTVLKWVLAVAIIAGLIYYGWTYSDQVREFSDAFASEAKETFEEWKVKAVNEFAGKNAKYTDNGDGTYTIVSGNIRLDGKKGSDKVKITIAGISASFTIDSLLEQAIEAAKANSGQDPAP